ncbi:hypothetical protein SMD11_1221 [Streptomyces albireticuli]|uniref:Uncharacterized protein n=1 Tax=Streptomyces albireticuli TaxID=1940 RepID=A0A1Z2KXU7_9ACTN|nr:hypothetical protein [Streptomyces albireticuli]ARZ66882.1 hypothetical protein SMD11_1221 [Streptomyces albireticuli]
MSYIWTSNAYEAGNSEMDLKNVPLAKVTIEVKEENKALIETLRKDLAEKARQLREVRDAKKYWVQRFEGERAAVLEAQEGIKVLKDRLTAKAIEADTQRSKATALRQKVTDQASQLREAEKQASAGDGHRYVRLVKHLTDREYHLKAIKSDAAREMAWEEGLGAEARLNEVEAALGAAGVR